MTADSFVFRGHELAYLDRPYNATRCNERAVEVPIAEAWCKGLAHVQGVEIGNVLDHYNLRPDGWGCVDLTEHAAGVTNVDVRTWDPDAPLDAVVAISTFEHVGWDDGTDPDGAWPAIERIAGLLAPDGAMLVTLPLGQNPRLDPILLAGNTSALTATTLVAPEGHPRFWHETEEPEFRPYIGHSGHGAGAVWIGQWGRIVL